MDDQQAQQDINTIIEANRLTAVYAYTPMCGTCQLAGKMLDVVEKVVKQFEWVRLDLNYYEEFAMSQAIESVPCLLIFKDGELMEKIYAFHSVPHIYEKLNQYAS
ncbi:thioredoxin family protein [Bacillus thermotolerans]|uniref:thioredoxin family protein n=1 Tax=Bacillus thermotolerans TaxID=1221996 RepID=UPI000582A19E|nr:thioredoxin family protein [Bacillus thermotolerans]KKB33156.1 Thioredoxin [Bacillus thermotolerans]